MHKWEYRLIEYGSPLQALQPFLNQQGEEGWELTGLLLPGSITPEQLSMREALSNTPTSLQLIFKRPRS